MFATKIFNESRKEVQEKQEEEEKQQLEMDTCFEDTRGKQIRTQKHLRQAY